MVLPLTHKERMLQRGEEETEEADLAVFTILSISHHAYAVKSINTWKARPRELLDT
jgi:hypothetical protein